MVEANDPNKEDLQDAKKICAFNILQTLQRLQDQKKESQVGNYFKKVTKEQELLCLLEDPDGGRTPGVEVPYLDETN